MAFYAQPAKKMDVIGPLNDAAERSRQIFFDKFDLGVWLRFGLIVFLANLISSGGGGGGGGTGRGGLEGGPSMREGINQAREFVLDNLVPILIVGGILVLIILALWLLFAWLSSRGQMMLIRAVSKNDAGIERNWGAVRRQADSVFLFRIVLAIIFVPCFLAIAVGAGAATIAFAESGAIGFAPLFFALLPFIGAAILVGLIAWVIRLLLVNFVMPVMYLEDRLCMEGWRRFFQIARGNWGPIILLFIIRFFYHIAFAVVAVIGGCITCCLGFLPYIHHTLFSPFYVFDRAYSLYALQSLGPDFQFIEHERGVVPPEVPEGYADHDEWR